VTDYIECAIQKAIQRLKEGDEASTAWSLISIAQSLDRIATAQERMANVAEQSEKQAEEYADAMTAVCRDATYGLMTGKEE
jgi:hypothetical protein